MFEPGTEVKTLRRTLVDVTKPVRRGIVISNSGSTVTVRWSNGEEETLDDSAITLA